MAAGILKARLPPFLLPPALVAGESSTGNSNVKAKIPAQADYARPPLGSSSTMTTIEGIGIRLNWSPEQIAGWLKRAHPGDEYYHMSPTKIAAPNGDRADRSRRAR